MSNLLHKTSLVSVRETRVAFSLENKIINVLLKRKFVVFDDTEVLIIIDHFGLSPINSYNI